MKMRDKGLRMCYKQETLPDAHKEMAQYEVPLSGQVHKHSTSIRQGMSHI